jgi:hypothetical protein
MRFHDVPFLAEEVLLYVIAAVLILAMIVLVGTIGGVVLVPLVLLPTLGVIYLIHRAEQHRHA